MSDDLFEAATRIADAVLYEGYVLYPYRASAAKNRMRFQWGVLGPPGADADGVGEDPTIRVSLALRRGAGSHVRVRLRGLRVVERVVERADGAGGTRVDEITIDGAHHVSFDDAELVVAEVTVAPGSTAPEARMAATTIDLAPSESVTPLGVSGGTSFRMVRRCHALRADLRVFVDDVGDDLAVVRVHVENRTPWGGGDRDAAVRTSLVGAHVVAAATGATFVSALDPPDDVAARLDDAGDLAGHRLWPALVGADRESSLVLAAPVILPDQPRIAPESRGDFHDGLEIDEMLSLRVLTLTEAEKAAARATDPRAAAIVDRVEAMDPADLTALHGRMDETAGTGDQPWWDPAADEGFDPDHDHVVVDGHRVSRGSVVRLRPNRRADAHDLFYRDRQATVAAVLHDVDGSVHVAVTIDDDPAADLRDETGRYLYFAPDEVRPLGRRVER